MRSRSNPPLVTRGYTVKRRQNDRGFDLFKGKKHKLHKFSLKKILAVKSHPHSKLRFQDCCVHLSPILIINKCVTKVRFKCNKRKRFFS